ncbi:MAG: regulatory protein RecX [Geminicoccaceae bacterium]
MPATVAPPTPERLHARALRYLERYATTAAHLRRVLLRRAARDAEALGLDTAPVRMDVDAVVARLVAAGLLDDRQFALARARRLSDTGRSPARIRAALAAKGLAEPAIEAALRGLAEEQSDPELAAAIAYARRRRLGPWRLPESRPENRAKDLAALGRAGFGYRAARLVADAADPEALTSDAHA